MPRKLVAPSPKPVTCAAVRPNAGIEAAYRRRLKTMVAEMNASILFWVTAAFRASPPELAQDAIPPPANLLIRRVRALGKRWEKKFAAAAPKLAKYFATAAADRSEAVLKQILKDGGFTVSFKTTPAIDDVLAASIQANVALIKSIPAQHFVQIEGMVMRATQTGRDLATLTKELKESFGVTERRAAFIAKDQMNKTTAVVVRARQEELGITHAIWLHSGGGNHPRPEHVAFSGKQYEIAKGAFLEGKWVWPGTEINCFPGDMPVKPNGEILALWRAPFDGPMVHVYIGSDLLKGTPNHPILTARGWIPLGLLDDGDKVVCMASQCRQIVGHNKYERVPTFSELFETWAREFGYVSRGRIGFNFYGDRPNDDVDEIVLTKSDLSLCYEAAFSQDRENFILSKPDRCRRFPRIGGQEQVLGSDAASTLDIRLADLSRLPHRSLHVGLRAGSHESAPYQHVSNVSGGVTGSTQLDSDCSRAETTLIQADNLVAEGVPIPPLIGRDAGSSKFFAEFIRSVADRESGIFEFDAAAYEFRSARNKVIRYSSGHVFTMQTDSGYYSIGNAFAQARNCRCVSKSIVPGYNP